jgi:hypothetical protein
MEFKYLFFNVISFIKFEHKKMVQTEICILARARYKALYIYI